MKEIARAQEVIKKRKAGMLKQAEKMFKALDVDMSDTVDTAEIVAAMSGTGSFARMVRQMGKDFQPKDIAPNGSCSLKKFKSFVGHALDEIEKAKEELAFGNMYESHDAAAKIQAVQRGKQSRTKGSKC